MNGRKSPFKLYKITCKRHPARVVQGRDVVAVKRIHAHLYQCRMKDQKVR